MQFFSTATARIFVLLLGFCLVLQTAEARKNNASRKKHNVELDAPEPDPMVPLTLPQRPVAAVPEAGDPLAIRYGCREGIDVSHYQGTIDWHEVATKGEVAYVYIKATEGSTIQDDCYDYNIHEARKAGLKVGSYHFFRANTSIDEQLRNMTAVVKKEDQDLVPIIDVELTNRVSSSAMVQKLKTFLERVTQYYGCKPILYTFVNFYNKHFAGHSAFDDYPLMIAFYRDYQPELNDGRKYIIWQYTAEGDVPGIDGNCDQSQIVEGSSLGDILMR